MMTPHKAADTADQIDRPLLSEVRARLIAEIGDDIPRFWVLGFSDEQLATPYEYQLGEVALEIERAETQTRRVLVGDPPIEGVAIELTVPFSGAHALLECAVPSVDLTPQRRVERRRTGGSPAKVVILTRSWSLMPTPVEVAAWQDAELDRLRRHVEVANDEARAHNHEVTLVIEVALESRRRRLSPTEAPAG